jgi:hypothetical protein
MARKPALQQLPQQQTAAQDQFQHSPVLLQLESHLWFTICMLRCWYHTISSDVHQELRQLTWSKRLSSLREKRMVVGVLSAMQRYTDRSYLELEFAGAVASCNADKPSKPDH